MQRLFKITTLEDTFRCNFLYLSRMFPCARREDFAAGMDRIPRKVSEERVYIDIDKAKDNSIYCAEL